LSRADFAHDSIRVVMRHMGPGTSKERAADEDGSLAVFVSRVGHWQVEG
jgi:hypothetical protein